jgi:hypothetical protein
MEVAMSEVAKLELNGKSYALPIVVGSEQERGIEVGTLLRDTGHITLDDGYGNTGSCKSAITFIDGDKGILRYRGIPILLYRNGLLADLRRTAQARPIAALFATADRE